MSPDTGTSSSFDQNLLQVSKRLKNGDIDNSDTDRDTIRDTNTNIDTIPTTDTKYKYEY